MSLFACFYSGKSLPRRKGRATEELCTPCCRYCAGGRPELRSCEPHSKCGKLVGDYCIPLAGINVPKWAHAARYMSHILENHMDRVKATNQEQCSFDLIREKDSGTHQVQRQVYDYFERKRGVGDIFKCFECNSVGHGVQILDFPGSVGVYKQKPNKCQSCIAVDPQLMLLQ